MRIRYSLARGADAVLINKVQSLFIQRPHKSDRAQRSYGYYAHARSPLNGTFKMVPVCMRTISVLMMKSKVRDCILSKHQFDS